MRTVQEVVQDIYDILYREGPDTEWDSATAGEIAEVVNRYRNNTLAKRFTDKANAIPVAPEDEDYDTRWEMIDDVDCEVVDDEGTTFTVVFPDGSRCQWNGQYFKTGGAR